MVDNKIYAPKIDPKIFWDMSVSDFNSWRRENDYPRIIDFLKKKLLHFDSWMSDQEVTDSILINYSPSSFLRDQSMLYLYEVLHDSKEVKEILHEKKFAVNETFFHLNYITKRKDILPYPIWYRSRYKHRSPDIAINMRQGRSCFLLSELELLDLGNCKVVNRFIIGDRLLDFTNLDDLFIVNSMNNTFLNLWFCTAHNLSIEGDLAFIDAFETQFYDFSNRKSSNLKLVNGNFQSWRFTNCEIDLLLTNAVIHLWKFTGWDFTATIHNSDIKDCKFNNLKIRYPIDIGRITQFHAHLKRLYSQIGKKKEASFHYYLEKTYERKSYLYPKANHRDEYNLAKGKTYKLLVVIKFIYKYICSGILNILWGYGERPIRLFQISILTIFTFAFVYAYSPHSSIATKNDFLNSLYFSTVSFTTLGFGDISQTNNYLKLLSAFEALLGMTFWGLLIAGFASNSKDY